MHILLKIVIGIFALIGFVTVAQWIIAQMSTAPTTPREQLDIVVQTDVELTELPVPEVTDYRELETRDAVVTEIVAGLDAPWAFTWLPSGDLLVTERFGTLRLVRDGTVLPESIVGVPEVLADGQGGLLDITIHPDFATNNYIYLSYAHGTNEANQLRIARAKLFGTALEELEVIFTVGELKTGAQHFGSRFAWLPDGTLLFSVGDGGNPPIEYDGELIREQAQKLSVHLGKIIRINDDGTIPADNPFAGRPDVNPEIYSFGHRNSQGIAYDAIHDRVIASEHGSKGGDELNLIEGGANFGWPRTTFATEYSAFNTPITEYESLPGMQNPLVVWTPTVAPSAVVAYAGDQYDTQGDIFMAAMLLRSSAAITAYASRPAGAVLRLETDELGVVTAQQLIDVGEVRVRSIAEGPDGYLYVLTDTTERQSRPGSNAGSIIRLKSF